MRLFFAVELPEGVRAALGRLPTTDPNYRWVDPAQLHITLAFLGERPETDLPLLESVGETAASRSDAALVHLGDPGSFGPRSAPRVLWIGLDGDLPALQDLHTNLAHGLREANFPVEDRPFQAHITLARRRDRATGGPPARWPPAHLEAAKIPLAELTLFQSKLSPRGATYIPLATFALRGATTNRAKGGRD